MNGLLIGAGCFALHVVVSLVWLRLSGPLSPVARHAVSALGTHALGVAIATSLAGPFAYWPAAAVSGFSAVCWLFAFSAVYKSVSLRILAELERTPGQSLSLGSITTAHVRPEFTSRIDVLARMGCVKEVDGGYSTTRKGVRTARRIVAVQRAFGIVASGMYGEGESVSCEREQPPEVPLRKALPPAAQASGSPVASSPAP